MMGFFIVLFAVNWVVIYMIAYVSYERGRVATEREFVETLDDCVQGLTRLDSAGHGPWEEGYKTAVEDVRNAIL